MKPRKSSRFLSLVLSAVMVLAMLPGTAFAAEVGVSTEQALNDAIAAASNGTVIKLTAGINEAQGFTITNNANFTIDLNGQTLDYAARTVNGIGYEGKGSMTIIDSSADQTGKITEVNPYSCLEHIIENRSSGTVNFVSGSLIARQASPIVNKSTGIINIRGGNIEQTFGTTTMIVNHSTGIINISGGTLTPTYGGAIEDKTNGQINISGGTLTASGETLIASYGTGTVNISGGTITATGNRTTAVFMKHGKLTVSQANDQIPTVISNISDNFATLSDNDYTIPVKTIFDIQGGTIKNTSVVGKAIAFDSRSNVNGKNIYNFIEIAPEAKITGSIYPWPSLPPVNTEQRLRDAIASANAKDGSFITLTGNINMETGTLAIAKDINITIDLNGYRLGTTGNFDTVTYSGTQTLNITDNSAAKSGSLNANGGTDQNCALRNTGTGTINVKRGTVETTKSYPAIVNDGTGKIIIGSFATISSANANTTNGGTIRINAVPTSGDKLALDIQGGKVKNTAPGGYSIYFAPVDVTTDNIDNYLRIAPYATIIGKRYPAPKPVFKAEYNVAGGSGSRLERSLNEIVADATGGITAADKAGGNSVSLKLTVAEKTTTDTEIEGLKQGDSVQYYDVTVEKIVTTPEGTSTPTVLTSIPKPVRAVIQVPAAIQGQASYSVYRIHGGAAEKIPNDPTALEFYSISADGKSLILHVRKFSTYAVITNNKSLTGDQTFGDTANSKNSAVDVQGKVLEGMFGVYKLDIAWGAMKFDYNAQGGVWNPDTHTYTPGGGTKGWTNESFVDPNNKITVANHSNGDVTLSYTATADAILAGATMTVRANNSLSSVLAENLLLGKVPAEAGTVPTIDAFVWLNGDPTNLKSATYTKAGVITITAEPDTAGGLTPKNPTP